MDQEKIQMYNTLGLPGPVSKKKLDAAYRGLTQIWHPETARNRQRFRAKYRIYREINKAYFTLRPDLLETTSQESGQGSTIHGMLEEIAKKGETITLQQRPQGFSYEIFTNIHNRKKKKKTLQKKMLLGGLLASFAWIVYECFNQAW